MKTFEEQPKIMEDFGKLVNLKTMTKRTLNVI
jgi:hypothetical protein